MTANSLPQGSFSEHINGFDMYCEIAGSGPLLIWLPGAFAGVDRLRALVDAFRQKFTVLTADANGQGRSSLGPGPITYVSMTADLVSLMDRLTISDAHFFGISDGGVCGLHMLVDFAHRVRSVSMSGTPYSHEAYSPSARQLLANFSANLVGSPTLAAVKAAYEQWSPFPAQFMQMASRAARTWETQPNFNQAMLSTITAATLVVTTDCDEYIPEVELRRLAQWIPSAKAFQMSGMPHSPVAHADGLATAVRQFVSELGEGLTT